MLLYFKLSKIGLVKLFWDYLFLFDGTIEFVDTLLLFWLMRLLLLILLFDEAVNYFILLARDNLGILLYDYLYLIFGFFVEFN
jgi:hypothetical protein